MVMVNLLPYVEQSSIYDQIDFLNNHTWGPNWVLYLNRISTYMCPSNPQDVGVSWMAAAIQKPRAVIRTRGLRICSQFPIAVKMVPMLDHPPVFLPG